MHSDGIKRSLIIETSAHNSELCNKKGIMENKDKIKIVYVKFSPLGNAFEFFCEWEDTQVGDFVVGRGELGESVGRVMKIIYVEDDPEAFNKLTRKATNNEAYECEEIFNLKHKFKREKKFIKGNGEVVVKTIDEETEEGSPTDEADREKLFGILRFVCIGIGIMIFMMYKEEIFELIGL